MDAYQLELVDSSTIDELTLQRGLNDYNKAHGQEPIVELTAFLRDDVGKVRGGAFGEFNWDWLYVDLLWVDADMQDQGHGARLIYALEQAARELGATYSYLATTSFQALPFYYRLGYRLFGVLEDRPPGYNYYYLTRSIPEDAPDDLMPIEEDPDPEDMDTLKRGLSEHNRTRGINPDGQRLSVFVKDKADPNRILGGLIGATYWGWLDIQLMWLDESLRGQGIGARMLRLAEAESQRRGCDNAFIDVGGFQNVGFFHAQRYSTFATLEDRPKGSRTHFMRKNLSQRTF